MVVQKRMEKEGPAKKVEAPRAACPDRKLRTAEAEQQSMITAIAT